MTISGDGERNDDSKSFADLIGDTKPIARGPERTARPARESGTLRPRATRKQTGAFRWPDPEEPRLAAAEGVNDAQLFALRRGESEPEERVDLHGLRRDAAKRLLADRIESARARGLRCIIVVHGRGQRSGAGEAVLRDALPEWLTKVPCANHLLAFAPAPNRHGGEGATLVLLRQSKRSIDPR